MNGKRAGLAAPCVCVCLDSDGFFFTALCMYKLRCAARAIVRFRHKPNTCLSHYTLKEYNKKKSLSNPPHQPISQVDSRSTSFVVVLILFCRAFTQLLRVASARSLLTINGHQKGLDYFQKESVFGSFVIISRVLLAMKQLDNCSQFSFEYFPLSVVI